tara:strand:- start:882 stop:1100 length:219 start_codon:yes stop_codon:yes gene_type:complete
MDVITLDIFSLLNEGLDDLVINITYENIYVHFWAKLEQLSAGKQHWTIWIVKKLFIAFERRYVYQAALPNAI